MQDYIMLFIIYINVMIINYIQCKRKQIKCTIYPNGVVFLMSGGGSFICVYTEGKPRVVNFSVFFCSN